MDFNSLTDIMNEERALYKELRRLFDVKKSVLIKNDIKTLGAVDKKILTVLASIKNLPSRESFSRLEEIYPSHRTELQTREKELLTLSKEISRLNRENLELIKHGIVLADKRLKTIIKAVTPKSTGYSKFGDTEPAIVSTIVQEV